MRLVRNVQQTAKQLEYGRQLDIQSKRRCRRVPSIRTQPKLTVDRCRWLPVWQHQTLVQYSYRRQRRYQRSHGDSREQRLLSRRRPLRHSLLKVMCRALMTFIRRSCSARASFSTSSNLSAARPEIFYKVGSATKVQYDIVSSTSTLGNGHCKPTSATPANSTYICRFTIRQARRTMILSSESAPTPKILAGDGWHRSTSMRRNCVSTTVHRRSRQQPSTPKSLVATFNEPLKDDRDAIKQSVDRYVWDRQDERQGTVDCGEQGNVDLISVSWV